MSTEYITYKLKDDAHPLSEQQLADLADALERRIVAGEGILPEETMPLELNLSDRDNYATELARVWPVGLKETNYRLRIQNNDGEVVLTGEFAKPHSPGHQFLAAAQWAVGILLTILMLPLALPLFIYQAVKAKGSDAAWKADRQGPSPDASEVSAPASEVSAPASEVSAPASEASAPEVNAPEAEVGAPLSGPAFLPSLARERTPVQSEECEAVEPEAAVADAPRSSTPRASHA